MFKFKISMIFGAAVFACAAMADTAISQQDSKDAATKNFSSIDLKNKACLPDRDITDANPAGDGETACWGEDAGGNIVNYICSTTPDGACRRKP